MHTTDAVLQGVVLVAARLPGAGLAAARLELWVAGDIVGAEPRAVHAAVSLEAVAAM
jgi:hypothetical protein